MNLKRYRPTNSSTRGLVNIDRSGLWKGGPCRSLVTSFSKSGGRNSVGRVTSWHRGGGAKMLYRNTDFHRAPCDKEATVQRIEYDPNRSAFIALIERDKELKYIIAPDGVKAGDSVGGDEIRSGSCIKLGNIPSGTFVHNIEMRPGSGACVVRAAGTSAQVLGADGDMVSVRLPSGQIKRFLQGCTAVVGVVSNASHMNRQYAKAGRIRWMGWRPVVRGTAMNAKDHKHGGGRGKAKGCHPVTPWGINTKGFRTRKKSKPAL